MRESKGLMKRDVRVVALGDVGRLPQAGRCAVEKTIEMTAGNRAMTVALALSYGGRQDIVTAARRIAQAVAAGRLAPDEIDHALLQPELTTPVIPHPPPPIRPPGGQPISHFLFYLPASP